MLTEYVYGMGLSWGQRATQGPRSIECLCLVRAFRRLVNGCIYADLWLLVTVPGLLGITATRHTLTQRLTDLHGDYWIGEFGPFLAEESLPARNTKTNVHVFFFWIFGF